MDDDGYRESTKHLTSLLTVAAIQLAHAKAPATDAVAELRRRCGDDHNERRDAVKLAIADSLVQDTDWLFRLQGAELLDLLEEQR